jgi:hypothetical protein
MKINAKFGKHVCPEVMLSSLSKHLYSVLESSVFSGYMD